MIVTVTLNPAVDRTIVVPDFSLGATNRATYSRDDAGGKGINVSRAVHALGSETVATGFIAGAGGRFIKDRLTSLGIRHDFVDVPGQVRTNIKIVSGGGVRTNINEVGFEVTTGDFDRILSRVSYYLNRGNTVVIGGRTPPNLAPGLYETLCRRVVDKGLPLIIDADGDRLRDAIPAGPAMMKINLPDLKALTGKSPFDPKTAQHAAYQIVKEGVGAILVPLGHAEAVYLAGDSAWHVRAPAMGEIRSPVGAWDAAVGAAAVALCEEMPHDILARFAVAAGTASAMAELPGMISRKEVSRIFGDTVAVPL